MRGTIVPFIFSFYTLKEFNLEAFPIVFKCKINGKFQRVQPAVDQGPPTSGQRGDYDLREAESSA